MTRNEIIKASKELAKWLESREFEVKELGLDFIHLHVKKSAFIRSLIALVPGDGMVVVPEEPTGEMLDELFSAGKGAEITRYKAMLKASQDKVHPEAPLLPEAPPWDYSL